MATQMKKIASVLALILGTAAHMLAQSANATLSGFVRDSQDAVIPNAKVTAVQIATHVIYSAVSSGDGAYTILNLPVGDYKVTAEAPGFKVAVVPVLTLQTFTSEAEAVHSCNSSQARSLVNSPFILTSLLQVTN